MGVFSSGGVGIDLGSANVTICLENEGIVLREPSYVLAMREDTEEVLGVGRDARQMLGRTPKDVVLLSPVMDGAVADVGLATLLMKALSEKALGKRRALEKNRLVVSMSTGATRVEHAAAEDAVRGCGAKRAGLCIGVHRLLRECDRLPCGRYRSDASGIYEGISEVSIWVCSLPAASESIWVPRT